MRTAAKIKVAGTIKKQNKGTASRFITTLRGLNLRERTLVEDHKQPTEFETKTHYAFAITYDKEPKQIQQ